MTIIDQNGNFQLKPGTLKAVDADHPVYRARIALALEKGSWMYAPNEGHELSLYRNVKDTDQNKLAYQKAVELYLSPYGPQVISRLSARGELVLEEQLTKETIRG